jgi:hypothetical protein
MRYFTRNVIIPVITQLIVLALCSKSEARDLTSVLQEGFELIPRNPLAITNLVFPLAAQGESDVFAFSTAGAALAPALSAAIANAVTQQSPLASVAPAFTYRYNPSLSVFERSTGVPGPLFSERALTIGKGQFNFGVGYSYVDMDDINGTDLQDTHSPLLVEAFCPTEDGSPLFLNPQCNTLLDDGTFLSVLGLGLSSVRTRLDIQAHVIVPTVRYGLTDNWDVGISVPVVNTFLRVRHELIPVAVTEDAFLVSTVDGQGKVDVNFLDRNAQPTDVGRARFFATNRGRRTLTKVAGSSTGVGDITLRSKYHFWGGEQGGAAAGLQLYLPSGDEDNFRGTGETHVSPFFYLSQVLWDRIEPHLNLGLDFNTEDMDRSAFLYSVGAVALVWDRLGAGIDIIGRSEFGRLQPGKGSGLAGLTLEREAATCSRENPCSLRSNPTPFRFPFKIKRNDIIDISFSLRYALGISGSIFFGAILPLNDDGFRADFIPSGGIEYTF